MARTWGHITPAIGAKKLFPVKEGHEWEELAFAAVAGLVELSGVQGHRFEEQAPCFLDHLELFGNAVINVIENCRPFPFPGETPLTLLKRKEFPRRVNNPHFDDAVFVHRVLTGLYRGCR
jgi:hypothetical protein